LEPAHELFGPKLIEQRNYLRAGVPQLDPQIALRFIAALPGVEAYGMSNGEIIVTCKNSRGAHFTQSYRLQDGGYELFKEWAGVSRVGRSKTENGGYSAQTRLLRNVLPDDFIGEMNAAEQDRKIDPERSGVHATVREVSGVYVLAIKSRIVRMISRRQVSR